MKPIIYLLTVSALFSQTSVLVPDTSLPAGLITACSGTPTRCTLTGLMTPTVPAFVLNDQVAVQGILVDSGGGVYKYSAMNSPVGVLRKICFLSGTTVGFCDLSNTPLQAEGTALTNLAYIRRATVGSTNVGPLGILGVTCSPSFIGLAVRIVDGSLTSIVVSGGVATVTYGNSCHHGLSTGESVQVRNASASNLNGVKPVAVTGVSTFTYTTSAANGTYTDTNLTVSQYAVDGYTLWEGLKTYIGGISFSPYVSQPTNWASGPAFGGQQCYTAALYSFIDPSQTDADSYATSCLTSLDDIWPLPYACDGSVSTNCTTTGNVGYQGQYNDYGRVPVPNILAAFSLHASRLSGGQRSYVASFFANTGKDIGTSCTSISSNTFGGGTVTITGLNIVGSGTNFLSHSVGDYIQFDNGGAVVFSRLATITDNTHATRTSTQFAGDAVATTHWLIAPPTTTSNCGLAWRFSHHAATGVMDPNIILSPWWVVYPIQPYPGYAGNNQGLTVSNYQSSYAALCAYSSDACDIFQMSYLVNYDTDLTNWLGWGMYNNAGAYYSLGRTGPFMAQELLMDSRATTFTGFSTAIAAGNGFKQTTMQQIYNTASSVDPATSDFQMLGWDMNAYWTLSKDTSAQAAGWAYSFVNMMAALPTNSSELGWSNNYLTSVLSGVFIPAVNAGGSAFSAYLLPVYNPNWSSTSFSTLPFNFVSTNTSNTLFLCGFLGVACPASSKYTGGISRVSWAFDGVPATVLEDYTSGLVGNDHGSWTPSMTEIVKGSSPENVSGAVPSVLMLDMDNPSDLNGGPCSCMTLGTNLGYLVDNVGIGSNLLWDSIASNDYYVARWDVKPLYGTTSSLSTAQKTTVHFKKSGVDEFVVRYHYATGATDSSPWYVSTLAPAASASWSSPKLTVTNSDGQRGIFAELKPAGTNSLAIINDGTSYTGQNIGWRVREAASTDGTTATSTPSSLEALEVGLITTSSLSSFTPTLLSPDSNWTGAQLVGPSTAAVVLLSRNGALYGNVADFTTTHSGTAQYLFGGLSPGTYSVSVGGVVKFTGTVSSGNSVIEFDSTAGLVSFHATIPTPYGNFLSGSSKVGGNSYISATQPMGLHWSTLTASQWAFSITTPSWSTLLP